ncbi:aryl-alcohol dehydrogenase-like predicted oxidoreductase [Thermocatellispora tengchongensis]|uniref:Aryl-alcohol dehydrogenase-like predicted oxidoreductase n=1 Tax=Thermocatellispora tengchongensis TaxID=1073253 RepID=A0A840PG69_9ACTN|nr:aldo/keto reductase [Thermocatellispora tengchongensis]MBB5136137.1 aryl-alcohol dehydrogenase-like predicted oxidoreductase [Thermocatellispora tengchongensis]
MFDTADSYGGGRSEEWLGRWLSDRGVRDQVVVATKVGKPVGDGAGLSERHIRRQVEVSLRRLRTDHLDLYLTHVHDPGTPVEETVTAFDRLAREGKIRHYGMSNCTGTHFRPVVEAADRLGVTRPINVQDDYNLLNRAAESDVMVACSGSGAGFTAFSPLAGGLLTGKHRAGTPAGSRLDLLPGWYAEHDEGHLTRGIARLVEAAEDYDLPPAALALAWVPAEPAVISALVAPRSPSSPLSSQRWRCGSRPENATGSPPSERSPTCPPRSACVRTSCADSRNSPAPIPGNGRQSTFTCGSRT